MQKMNVHLFFKNIYTIVSQLIPLGLDENIETIIHNKNVYSHMLNNLGADGLNGGLIERRHKFAFKIPDKTNIRKAEAVRKENINKSNEVKAYSIKSQGFLSLDLI